MPDIMIGLVPAVAWGMQGIVMQKLGGRTANKQMGMVLTALVVAVGVLIVRPPTAGAWTSTLIVAAVLNGVPWTIGQILQIRTFEMIGVSRTIPISTGMQLFGTTLVGVAFFNEWVHGWQFGIGVPALILLVIGVWMTTFQEKTAAHDGLAESGGSIKKGILLLLVSSMGYVLYATSGLIFEVDPLDLLFPQAVVMVIATGAIAFGTAKKGEAFDRETGVFGSKSWVNMLTGICFAVGNLAAMISVQRNGAAVGWTLSQMNVIVATIGGLIILKERKTKKELVFVLGGLVLVAVGGILVGVTKN
ncbi:glucose uptake protein [Micrococcales bacterium KH10]|nr:glucose uptake protein [Micrococcales bacterium KH10]